jgi:hypothetical protein
MLSLHVYKQEGIPRNPNGLCVVFRPEDIDPGFFEDTDSQYGRARGILTKGGWSGEEFIHKYGYMMVKTKHLPVPNMPDGDWFLNVYVSVKVDDAPQFTNSGLHGNKRVRFTQ